MLSKFALYWDMFSSVDLIHYRKRNKPRRKMTHLKTLSTERIKLTRSKIINVLIFASCSLQSKLAKHQLKLYKHRSKLFILHLCQVKQIKS